MATISDGTTDLDLGSSIETIDPQLEKSSKRTGGGNIRAITGGERFKMSVQARLTAAQYRTFIDLMNNGANEYFFTPSDSTQWTDLYPATTWPLSIDLTGLRRQWDNRTSYYVDFTVESASYV